MTGGVASDVAVAAVVAAGWVAVIFGLLVSAGPSGLFSRTRPRPLDGSGMGVAAAPATRPGVGPLIEAVGRWCRVRCGRAPDGQLDRRAGVVVVTLALGLPLDVRLGLVATLIAAMLPILRTRREVRDREREVIRELPEVVDLFTVAVRGGLTTPLAIAAVGARLQGPVAAALRRAGEQARLGRRLTDELERIPRDLGDAVRPLVRALIAADRYGVPIAESLERIAVDVRIERRRAAEIAARRVPVKLLFPLVFCVLPSFALLTVAPVLASSLESLR